MHQAPTTFDHAVTSDHRFFDRWAVGVQHPAVSVIYGMANYKNTDVCDGFLCVQHGDRQYNLRLSRPLRPDFDDALGPLGIEVIEPLWPTAWSSSRHGAVPAELRSHLDRRRCPPREEHPHHQPRRRAGRCRTTAGSTSSGRRRAGSPIGDAAARRGGCVRLAGPLLGRASGHGRQGPGHRPHRRRGTAPRDGIAVHLAGLPGRSGAGQFQLREVDVGGRSESIDGHLIPDIDDPSTSLEHRRHPARHLVRGRSHRLRPRSTCWSRRTTAATWDFEHAPLRPPWDFSGGGYSGGWDDGRVWAWRAAWRWRPTSTTCRPGRRAPARRHRGASTGTVRPTSWSSTVPVAQQATVTATSRSSPGRPCRQQR